MSFLTPGFIAKTVAGVPALPKRRRNPADSGVLAPGQSTAVPRAPIPPPAPVPTTQASSEAMLQAQQAGLRQRRRARAGLGGGLTTPSRNPAALLQPRTLLGGSTGSLLGG